MTEEIKEILFQLEIVARKHTIEVLDDGNIETMPASVVHELRLNNYSAKILLNYITNLQKENEKLKEDIEHYKIMFSNYFYEELYPNENEEDCIYKSRNEKAIKNIEDCKKANGDKYTCIIDHNYLLSILQGGDE